MLIDAISFEESHLVEEHAEGTGARALDDAGQSEGAVD